MKLMTDNRFYTLTFILLASLFNTSYAETKHKIISYKIEQTNEINLIKHHLINAMNQNSIPIYTDKSGNNQGSLNSIKSKVNSLTFSADTSLFAFEDKIKLNVSGALEDGRFHPISIQFLFYSDEDIWTFIGSLKVSDISKHEWLNRIPVYDNFHSELFFDGIRTAHYPLYKGYSGLSDDEDITINYSGDFVIIRNPKKVVNELSTQDFNAIIKNDNLLPKDVKLYCITEYLTERKFIVLDSSTMESKSKISISEIKHTDFSNSIYSLNKIIAQHINDYSYRMDINKLVRTFYAQEINRLIVDKNLDKFDIYDIYWEIRNEVMYENGTAKRSIPKSVKIYVSGDDKNNKKGIVAPIVTLTYEEFLQNILSLKLSDLHDYVTNYDEHEALIYWNTDNFINNTLVEKTH